MLSIAIGAACAGACWMTYIYAAVDEAIKARAWGLPTSPAFGGFALLHFGMSQLLCLILDLLKWLGCTYALAPTWWRGYNTKEAVDCYFANKATFCCAPLCRLGAGGCRG
jgi:hypothetical protein